MWGIEQRLSLRAQLRAPGLLIAALASLAVAEAAALIIIAFVRFHERFDHWIPDHERVVALWAHQILETRDNLQFTFTAAPPAAVEALPAAVPEVLAATRLGGKAPVLIGADGRRLRFTALYGDPHVFEVLGLRLIAGDEKTALSAPGRIVLTRRMAEALFGSDPALGATVNSKEHGPLTVAGVIADLPPDTHLAFDALISGATLPPPANPWGWGDGSRLFRIYLKLARPIAVEEIARLIQPILAARMPSHATGQPIRADVCRLTELHIYQPITQADLADPERRMCDFSASGISAAWLATLKLIAGVVLALGALNAAMLLIAQSLRRSREVAMKRVLGAGRRAIARSFLLEGVALALASAAIAAVLAVVARPFARRLFDVPALPLLAPDVMLGFLGLTLAAGLAAGAYPAVAGVVLRPSRAFVSERATRGGGAIFFAIAFIQAAAAAGLVAAAFLVRSQMEVLAGGDFGFDADDVLLVGPAPEHGDTLLALRRRLARDPDIAAAALADTAPGEVFFTFAQPAVGGEPRGGLALVGAIERTAVKTLGLRVLAAEPAVAAALAGEGAHSDLPVGMLVATRDAVRALGFATAEAALGTEVSFRQTGAPAPLPGGRIAAVIAPVRASALGNGFPRYFRLLPAENFGSKPDTAGPAHAAPTHLYLRPRPGAFAAVWRRVEALLADAYPLAQVPVAPLRQVVLETLRQTRRLQGLLLAAGMLTALLGALGVAGFAALAGHRSRHWVAIHRLAGAPDRAILRRVGLRLLMPVLVALPVGLGAGAAFFLAGRRQFSIQADVSPAVLGLVTAAALAVALTMVVWQIMGALRLRPVEVLRAV